MHFPASQKKFVLMFLGVFATVSLIFTTWAMTRVSAWIVYHDPVWIQMSQEEATLEHGLAEVFFGVGHGGFLVIIEAFCGIAFLVLLWHTLYRHEHTSPKDAS